MNSDGFAEINITPFTDVLLVLLIIFMVLAALVAPTGFEKQLGCGSCGGHHATIRPHRLTVAIDAHGDIFVGSLRVRPEQLYGALTQAVQHAHASGIDLVADRHAPYGLALRVLDAAKDGGISDVRFVTE